MARTPSVSFSDVEEAYRKVESANQNPSFERVRKMLGQRGGSDYVHKLWQEVNTRREVEKDAVAALPKSVADKIVRAAAQIFDDLKQITDQDIAESRIAIERREQSAEAKLTAAALQVSDLEAEVEQVRAKFNEAENKLQAANQDVLELRRVERDLREALNQRESKLATIEATWQSERERFMQLLEKKQPSQLSD